VKKLAGSDLWRIRVGRYRVVYAIDDEARLVTVAHVVGRNEGTYRGV
jgi:mRNA-degrading endonuclease RelE of RelBE toxin-antitoxin system